MTMASETCAAPCDDSFNEFVHDRTLKNKFDQNDSSQRNIALEKLDGCDNKINSELIDDSDINESFVATKNNVNELLRSEGSGSENGMDAPKNDLIWYRNEKLLKDKYQSHLTSIHTKNIENRNNENTPTTKWPIKPGFNLQSERMESFDSNKEYIGSDYGGSPLSGYSPSKKYNGCRSPAEWEDDDDDWVPGERPTCERWPPLGAPNDDDCHSTCSFEELGRSHSEAGRLKELEEEQEQLNGSLMSLTSHFAQVQFRLKQIVLSEAGEKERLLKELERFADLGIPDIKAIQQTRENVEKRTANWAMDEQRELISRLKQQLDELEEYAYHTGKAGLPQTVLVQKQKVIIEQLQGKLPLDLDNLAQLSTDDLRNHVDTCVKQIVNPLKMKEQLVSQLQTQIGDLERFIDFLQDDGLKKLPEGAMSPSNCNCGNHATEAAYAGKHGSPSIKKYGVRGRPHDTTTRTPRLNRASSQQKEQLREDTAHLVDRATMLINMLRFAQLGCGGAPSDYRTGAPTAKGNHWGDLRANLELATATLVEQLSSMTAADSDSDGAALTAATPSLNSSQEVTLIVRKQFVPALRDLIHHGLSPASSGRSLVSWSCFPSRSPSGKLLHAWDLVLQYYHLKRGDHYNTTPARRLSQSFNLELSNGSISGGCAGQYAGHRGALLAAVGNILATHTPLKRSPDSHFKAFVSEALNQQRLVVWLRLLLRCQHLVQKNYQPWSYVLQTGFEDALKSLEAVQQFQFSLPVDLAVRSLRNIADAF